MKLFKKKECTVLTWPARFVVLSFFLISFYLVFTQMPLFLSKTNPIPGDYLVLDGQMPDYSIQKAIELFDESSYKSIIVTGSKLPVGYFLSGKKTMAELTYITFLELGFDSAKIVAIPGGTILKDRTYSSGLTLKSWLNIHKITNAKIDILSIGCHARRSQDLFQKALGENFEVGSISVEEEDFEIKDWWKTSAGVRTVISEMIAFVYVKLFFHPK